MRTAKNKNPAALTPKCKLWLSSQRAEGVFGDGKWRLLKALYAKGSLTAAAQSLEISYRKAWGDLKKAEKNLKTRLIEKRRGGRTGGQTVLTKAGRKWLNAYSRYRADIEKAMEKAYRKNLEKLRQ